MYRYRLTERLSGVFIIEYNNMIGWREKSRHPDLHLAKNAFDKILSEEKKADYDREAEQTIVKIHAEFDPSDND